MSKASMRRRWQNVDGVLLLDKPQGISSNDALQRARRCFQAAKAGHTGTLDPMATGLLPVLFGEATKFSHMLLEADKTYLATMRLGVKTTTGDAEGEVLITRPVNVGMGDIQLACERFVGEIDQMPPMHSALKHEGKALYEYARKGIEIERQARRVTIHALELRRVVGSDVDIRVRCSKGTYIRTLAEDIGEALGCGAHLIALRRSEAGPLKVEHAIALATLEALDEDSREAILLPVDALLCHLPTVKLEEDYADRFGHGQAVACNDDMQGQVRVYGGFGFLGLGEVDAIGVVKPIRLIVQRE